MPKKTKKAKILAQQRKLIPPRHTPTNHSDEYFVETETSETRYFVKDLKKSLTLIAIIFTLEILLYFATMSNYISKLIRF